MFKQVKSYVQEKAALVGEYLPGKKSLATAGTVGTGLAFSTASHADIGTTISAAFAAGQTNLGLAAAGVITMVAVLTGIGLIVSMLRK